MRNTAGGQPPTPPAFGRVVHCKRDPHDVYIGRPSAWGNPFSHRPGTQARFVVGSRDEAVAAYKRWLWERVQREPELVEALAGLAGKTLGCWCAPQSCHGDVLVSAAVWAAGKLNNAKGV